TPVPRLPHPMMPIFIALLACEPRTTCGSSATAAIPETLANFRLVIVSLQLPWFYPCSSAFIGGHLSVSRNVTPLQTYSSIPHSAAHSPPPASHPRRLDAP